MGLRDKSTQTKDTKNSARFNNLLVYKSPMATKKKKKAIDGHHLSSHYIKQKQKKKKYQHYATGQADLFVKMKRTESGEEAGARHSKAAQTQH